MLKLKFRDYLVNSFIKRKGLSEADFCQHCGITQEEFETVMKGENYDLITILKMGSYMGLQIRHFFEAAKE